MKLRFKKKETIAIISIVILFVVSSYYSSKYSVELKGYMAMSGNFGELIYVLIMMSAVIIAPFETLPLMPIAVNIWGANTAAFLTVAGWSLGSLVAFFLARIFGQRIVCRIINKCDIDEWRAMAPKKNLFWPIVFARIILPVDIISYAVGLFTKMSWWLYFLATLLGIIPFAFFFAHGSEFPTWLQIIIGLVFLIFLFFKYHDIKEYINKSFRNGKRALGKK